MQNPKIIFFDIDDTLYRKNTDTLRPSVGQALHALKQRNILTAIATGRPPVAIPPKVRQLIQEIGIDMLITINGQYIEFQGKILQHHPLHAEEISHICHLLEQKNIAYAFVNPHEIVTSEDTEWVVDSLAKILPNHRVDRHYHHQQPIYQMLAFYPSERDNEISMLLAEKGIKTVRWHEKAVDMLHQEGSKAQGIAAAIAQLGIEMQDVMAFGDGLNDIEMLQTVGFGVAMGNGAPEAQAVADYVCPSVDEDGVWRGLKALGVID